VREPLVPQVSESCRTSSTFCESQRRRQSLPCCRYCDHLTEYTSERNLMLDDAPAFTRWLSCPDCDSELWQARDGPSETCGSTANTPPRPTGLGPGRRVRLLLPNAAPDQTPERPPR
jgi:hypothetical protein